MYNYEIKHKFISLEPLSEKLCPILKDFVCSFQCFQWVIVGAETGNRREKVIPEKEWIMDIREACREAGIPVFMKNSLKRLMGKEFVQEFPW